MAASAKEYSMSALSVELNMDRRTIAKKLKGLQPCRVTGSASKRIEYYYLAEVFQHLLNGDGRLDPSQETAKLNAERRKKVELEVGVLQGQLCRTELVSDLWFEHINNCKSRLRAIPHKSVHRIMGAKDIKQGLKIAEDAIEEALDELSGSGVPEPEALAVSDDETGVEATPKTNSKRVGRRKTKAKS